MKIVLTSKDLKGSQKPTATKGTNATEYVCKGMQLWKIT